MERISQRLTGNPQGFNWSDFLSFRRMIALKIIQVLYIVVAVIITLAGVFAVFKSDRGYSSGFMPTGFFGGLLIIVFGNVMWRLWCEFVIVLFRINSSLSNIDENTRK